MEVKIAIMGTRLKELRKERKMTQKAMAELLEVSDRHYQAIEAGSVNIPSLTLKFLADYFDVSADYLLGRTDNSEVNH